MVRTTTGHHNTALRVLLVVFVCLQGCDTCEGLTPNASGELGRVDAGARATRDAGADGAPAAEPSPPPRTLCVHQRRPDLGAPVHRRQGGGGGYIRLSECTELAVIERYPRWLLVAFPETEGRTEGWISQRYTMDCSACGAGGEDEPETWPPRPRGMCLTAGASGRERFRQRDPPGTAEANGGAHGVPGVKALVVSYNVWELYDGRGEPRYLAEEAHGGTPAEQFRPRCETFAETLGDLQVDVLLLQEIESAEVACLLAAQTWPGSGWSCYSGARGSSATPQNVAIATRLRAKARLLEPTTSAAVGPRPALELSLEGAGGLTITAVHLKSSRGRQGPEDCANARQRMGAATALAQRYRGWSSVLIAGDFNIDPLDTGRTLYDRTADILQSRGFKRACPTASGCATPTYIGYTPASAIDLAFFKGGGRWRVGAVRVLKTAPQKAKTPRVSDHLPLLIELRR